jgi:flagella basal body P-ring formation protein FlgA
MNRIASPRQPARAARALRTAAGGLLAACLCSGPAPALSAAEPAPPPQPALAQPAAPSEHPFSESDLLGLLTSALQRDYVKEQGELELRLSQPWKTRSVPDEPLTVRILDLPTTGITSSFLVRLELNAGGHSLGSWQLPVQARIWRDVWVAHAPLKRGDLLSTADLVKERRDLLALHEPLADLTADDTTLEIAESVQTGTPLLARQLRLRPVIHRGQLADAVIRDGALSITMKVEVLEDGVPGQVVHARNSLSRRDLWGKVLNEQTILVSL